MAISRLITINSNTLNDLLITIGLDLAEKIPNVGVSPVDYMGQPLAISNLLS